MICTWSDAFDARRCHCLTRAAAGLQHTSTERKRKAPEPHSVSDAGLEHRVVRMHCWMTLVCSSHAFWQGRGAAALGGRHGAAWNCRAVHVQHWGACPCALQSFCHALMVWPGVISHHGSVLARIARRDRISSGCHSQQVQRGHHLTRVPTAYACAALQFITLRTPGRQRRSGSKRRQQRTHMQSEMRKMLTSLAVCA